ncbi:EamA family transporter, partial [Achromobacter xylosoxidans]
QQGTSFAMAMTGGRAAVIAGCGVALQYSAIAQADAAAGLWPMAANRMSSILVILAGARMARVPVWPGRRYVGSAAWLGIVAAISLALYQAATRHSLVSIAVPLASLYPVVPVVLGVTLLQERLSRLQWLGVATATLGIVLVVSDSH